ncbi:hypothetical protein M3Y98_00018500 [Aphelenchoides besseyi]|nr:hypothetical protein M3Y98_00018500 [Aphelenchoides besseyi]
MSLQDIVTLFCATLFPAYMSYHGHIYYSKSMFKLQISLMMSILAFWIAYSQTSLLLAINCSLCLSSSYQHIFEGKE